MTSQGMKKYLDLNALAHFVPKPEESRYDYTCWAVRAQVRLLCLQELEDGFSPPLQFQCEYAPGTEPATVATDWKINLFRDSTPSQVCDVNQLINDLGGPLFLAQQLRERNLPQTGPYSFVILGESSIARIMESMTCGWAGKY